MANLLWKIHCLVVPCLCRALFSTKNGAFQPLEILQLEPDQPATPVAQSEVRDAHVPWFQP